MSSGNSANGLNNGPGPGGSLFKYLKSGKVKRIRVDVESSKSSPNIRVHISRESDPAKFNENKDADNNNYRRCRNSSDMTVDDDRKERDRDHSDQKWKDSSRCVPKIDTHVLEEEKLILMPEEAIFLSFGVGCLAIYNAQGQAINYRQCWKKLVTVDPDFPTQYAAYHYFRGKNWVPKNGDNYGASYGKLVSSH